MSTALITPSEISRGVKNIKKLISHTQKEMKEDVGDKEFIAMLRSDIKDFQRVIVLLKAKNVSKLMKKVRDMDTAPRDEVLVRLGKLVSIKLGYEPIGRR